jgi:hypothetical protein
MRGFNFIPSANIFEALWAYIHTALLDQALTNVGHEDAYVMFVQIQFFWFSTLKSLGNGNGTIRN